MAAAFPGATFPLAADPAFDAHLPPIGDWANAVWEEWVPEASLYRLVRYGLLKLRRAKKTWAVC